MYGMVVVFKLITSEWIGLICLSRKKKWMELIPFGGRRLERGLSVKSFFGALSFGTMFSFPFILVQCCGVKLRNIFFA